MDELWRVVVALLGAFVIVRAGLFVIRSLAIPPPQPPPAGELRKVDLRYRCSLCATEVKMTTATEELPSPPRHCQEDMDLVAPVDE